MTASVSFPMTWISESSLHTFLLEVIDVIGKLVTSCWMDDGISSLLNWNRQRQRTVCAITWISASYNLRVICPSLIPRTHRHHRESSLDHLLQKSMDFHPYWRTKRNVSEICIIILAITLIVESHPCLSARLAHLDDAGELDAFAWTDNKISYIQEKGSTDMEDWKWECNIARRREARSEKTFITIILDDKLKVHPWCTEMTNSQYIMVSMENKIPSLENREKNRQREVRYYIQSGCQSRG